MSACAVSVVLSVFRSEETLKELVARIHASLDSAGLGHEIICVNDGCPGSSWQVLEEISRRDNRITAIDLNENIGQHRAVLVGMEYAGGSAIAVMDADLQDSPEALPELVRSTQGKAIAFARRCGAHQSRSRMVTSWAFKRVLSWLTGFPWNAGMFFVVPREVGEKLLRTGVRHPYVPAMLGSLKVPHVVCPVQRNQRSVGQSSYSFMKRMALGMRALLCVCELRWGRPRSSAGSGRSCVRTVLKGGAVHSQE